jgi:ankyrin repeat protein
LKRLLDAGADADAVDKSGATALLHAVVGDSLVAAEVLTKRGAWVDGRKSHTARLNESSSSAESEDRDETKKQGGWTPLTWASRKGQAHMVAVLLEANADPNVTGGGGVGSQTPMIHAAMGGHVEVVDMLAKAGADPKIRDDKNFDATMHAAFRHPQNTALLAAVARAANEWRGR